MENLLTIADHVRSMPTQGCGHCTRQGRFPPRPPFYWLSL